VAVYKRNLLLMVVIWAFASFAFFMVPFYIGTLDFNIYLMSTATAFGEVLSSVICLLVTHHIDKKKSISFFTGISCLGSLAVTLIIWLYHGNDQVFPALAFLLLYTGVVTMFDLIYVIVPTLFPTIFLATSYGCCNVVGRGVSMFAPMVARAPFPWPMLILAAYSFVCIFLPWGLIPIKSKQETKV
jgi:hypothetical protein